jgi:hypothetical protein
MKVVKTALLLPMAFAVVVVFAGTTGASKSVSVKVAFDGPAPPPHVAPAMRADGPAPPPHVAPAMRADGPAPPPHVAPAMRADGPAPPPHVA